MNTYRLRYIAGPQESLRASQEHQIQAKNLGEALATRIDWPVHYDTVGQCAWAWNPGTSLYDVEAWEAVLVRTAQS